MRELKVAPREWTKNGVFTIPEKERAEFDILGINMCEDTADYLHTCVVPATIKRVKTYAFGGVDSNVQTIVFEGNVQIAGPSKTDKMGTIIEVLGEPREKCSPFGTCFGLKRVVAPTIEDLESLMPLCLQVNKDCQFTLKSDWDKEQLDKQTETEIKK